MRHILWIGVNSVDADARYAVMLSAGERLACLKITMTPFDHFGRRITIHSGTFRGYCGGECNRMERESPDIIDSASVRINILTCRGNECSTMKSYPMNA
jgi:hypothetical protein